MHTIDTDNNSLIYEIKIEDVYEDFSKDKEMFDFSNYSVKSKYYDDSNELVVGKMKDQVNCFATKEFLGLMPKIYSFLVDDISEDKEAKGVDKNVAAAIIHSE